LAAHNFVQQLVGALPSSVTSMLGASAGANSINGLANKIPANQTVVFDLWVSSGKVQEIEVDLNQFAHKYSFAVPLRVVISPGTPIQAPTGATNLDLSKIPQLLGGLISGGLGRVGGSGSSSSGSAI